MAEPASAPRTRRKRAHRAPAPVTPDPIEIAMEAEKADRAPDSPARRLLLQQEKFIGWQIANQRVGFALKVLGSLAAVAAAGVLGAMAWTAHQADGLVVEAFLVPPALASQGLTGEVVARDVLDSLAELDQASHSLFAVKVSDAWTRHTKIEVPRTGVSLDELQRLLRRWLGHETYLSGEIVQTAAGLRLKARTGAGGTVTVEGSADQLPDLTQQAAEQLFAKARPNSYAEMLSRQGDLAGARRVLAGVLSSTDDPHARSLAYNLLGIVSAREGRMTESLDFFRRATRSPDPLLAALAANNVAIHEATYGHAASAAAARDQAARLASGGGPKLMRQWGQVLKARQFSIHSNYVQAERTLRPLVGLRIGGASVGFEAEYGVQLASLHEISTARRIDPGSSPQRDLMAEDWPALLGTFETTLASGGGAANAPYSGGVEAPARLATRVLVLTRVGRLADARALSERLPADCYSCLAARGAIANASGDVAQSDRWFAAAVRLYPKGERALLAWGRERLARGEADLAIESFKAAHRAAPQFADPLAWWGEALLAKGDAGGAARKFSAASAYAPRWGRLHLKWGDALAKLGKADEARAKWRAAAAMDLSAADRAIVAARLR